MTLAVSAGRGPLLRAGCSIAVPILPGVDGADPTPGEGAAELAALGLDATQLLVAEAATGKAGEVIAVPVHRDGIATVFLVGVGDGSPRSLRRAGAALARSARAKSGRAAASSTAAADDVTLRTTLAAGRDGGAARAVSEGLRLASYRFSRRSVADDQRLREAVLVLERPAAARAELARAAATTDAVALARDLANAPSLEKSPDWLAEQAVERCRDAGVSATVRDERALAAEGFGGILAVGAGSARPPRLVEMTWSPRGAKQHVVLVGKGITFDTGGLSLKPADSMAAMKTDMAGAAAVIATMTALAALNVKAKVTGLVPLAENMPGASAMRPGDVIRHYGGVSSEVLNTDAEGRLVLADALAYAASRLRPDSMVDIATLTGAATLGLGKRHGALYATSPALAGGLLAAAEAAGERLWHMPLSEDYRFTLDSEIADLRNIGRPEDAVSGGSIVAALFLREFVADVPWAHLDVAGPARADEDDYEITKGATGFGVRTFLRWLSVV